MDIGALLTSAAINTGLSVLLFSLYSILRKQPSNTIVYFGRRLASLNNRNSRNHFSFERFVPSPSWIVKAWETTENEILAIGGLDAVVFQRILVFRWGHIRNGCFCFCFSFSFYYYFGFLIILLLCICATTYVISLELYTVSESFLLQLLRVCSWCFQWIIMGRRWNTSISMPSPSMYLQLQMWKKAPDGITRELYFVNVSL